ncbi:MAG: hypothetical protein HY648_08980 [Acidobacteria bacterium]|nr:hypothetical protein [Acidobacteriota bacterium]
MSVRWFPITICIAAMVAPRPWAQEGAGANRQLQQGAAPPAIKLEDFERQLGPLEVKGQRFTVVQIEMAVRAS